MMTYKNITGICLVTLIVVSCKLQNQSARITEPKSQKASIFNKGKKVTNDNFTGTAWVNYLVQADTVYNTSIGSVTFEPGARSNWHLHPSGQILLVTEGLGYYQEKGKQGQLIRKGEIVKCPPNIAHWHGGSVDSSMTHIAISPNMEKGNAVWLEKVTDEEYERLQK